MCFSLTMCSPPTPHIPITILCPQTSLSLHFSQGYNELPADWLKIRCIARYEAQEDLMLSSYSVKGDDFALGHENC